LTAQKDIIILIGPTASGKTAVSIPLALKQNAEIISADSRLVYKGLDIGTAKPTMEERGGIPHYLIDLVNPNQEFTVAEFQKLALEKIDEIHKRGKVALVVGGTGLYVRSLVDNPSFQDQPPVALLREQILEEIAERGAVELYKELENFDPEAASKIHPNNIPRLVRALEVVRATGHPFSESIRLDHEQKPENLPYRWIIIGLNLKREILYDRINRRVLKMVADGWVDEVQYLLKCGYTGAEKPLTGLGYRDVVRYCKGEISLEEAIELTQRDTRRFSKRQMTFFRGIAGINWVDLHENNDPVETALRVMEISRVYKGS
jgi:tRNA dimethylallyltransferase